MALCTSTSEETLTLTSPPPTFSHEDSLPTLPLDLVVDILCRLPVKFLLQFRSVCKLWNSLISDLKFAKKHLHLSATRSFNSVCYFDTLSRYIFESRPLDSLFSTKFMDIMEIEYLPNGFGPFVKYNIVGSCNGIICLAHFHGDYFVLLWNPSIRKFKELPPFGKPKVYDYISMNHGFGYDHVNDNYKVVVVLRYSVHRIRKTKVNVYSFGTNLWKSIGEFPFDSVPVKHSGTFVGGAINWLASKRQEEISCLIVSFNLKNESYQEILQPDYGKVDAYDLNLGVLRDCLCIISSYEVWLMKEYGNKESWTKLLTISSMQNPRYSCFLTKTIYMFADDQVLLESFSNRNKKLIVYDLKTNNLKFINFRNKSVNHQREWIPEVCIESLILP